MNAILGQAALSGFILALVVHVGLLFGIDVADRMPVVWVLDAGVLALFVPFVVTLITESRRGPDAARTRMAIPTWVLALALCLLAYALVLSALFAWAQFQDGSPELAGGKYLQVDAGKAVHLVGLPKYLELRTSLLGVLSGHWLFFYFALYAWFTSARKTGPSEP